MSNNAYFDLIDLIEKQNKVIQQQAETIIKLLNETAEKESVINALME